MDIASLNLDVKSDPVKQATVSLRELAPAASAAERAAQRWGTAASASARSAEDFSRRVQTTIKALAFEREQLTRNAAEQVRYSALRRAGVTAASAEGQAITASVRALQAQQAALNQTTLAGKALGSMWGQVRALLVSFSLASAAASLIQMAKSAFESASGLEELAEQLGVSSKLLQSMQYQAVQAGVKTEQLETGLGKFSQKMGEAADGSKEMIEALQKIGVKNLDMQGNLRPTEDLLTDVARAIMAIDDPARRSAAAVDFFGKTGIRMLPMLGEIAKGADAMAASTTRAGAMISEETIKKLDAIADRLERSKLEWRKFFADNIADAADWFDKIVAMHETLFAKDIAWVKSSAAAFKEWVTDIVDGFNVAGVRAVAQFLEAFRQLPDQLGKLFTDGMNGAIGAVERGINRITSALADKAPWLGISGGGISLGRIEGGGASLGDMSGKIMAAGDAAVAPLIAGQTAARDAAARQAIINRQAGMQGDASRAGPGGSIPANLFGGTSSKGAGLSAVKDAGKSEAEAYRKLVAGAEQYIALKKIETDTIGMNADAAARLKHEQELLGKAVNDNMKLGPAQVAQLKSLADGMAKADAAFKAATFMDDVKTKSTEFLAAQQLERDALFMGAEAAARLRFETEALNDAKRQGIELSPAQVAAIQADASAMAASQEKTRQLTEMMTFSKGIATSLFTDFAQGIQQGKTIWESFGNAGVNALNAISNKLIEMAASKLMEAAFSGFGGGAAGGVGNSLGGSLASGIGGGGGGGLIGSAIGFISGLFADGAAFRNGNVIPFALGGAFNRGGLIPFAAGGIVTRPTTFEMAGGRTGVMGEKEPEAIMPLVRAPGGRLGVQAHGGGGGDNISVTVNLGGLTVGEFVSRAEVQQGLRQVHKAAMEGAMAGIISRRKRGGLKDAF